MERNEKFKVQYLNDKSKGVKAQGTETPAGFKVLKGSIISKEVTNSFKISILTKRAYNLRRELVKEGIVSNKVFVRDYVFPDKRLAASVLLGENVSSHAWKNQG